PWRITSRSPPLRGPRSIEGLRLSTWPRSALVMNAWSASYRVASRHKLHLHSLWALGRSCFSSMSRSPAWIHLRDEISWPDSLLTYEEEARPRFSHHTSSET